LLIVVKQGLYLSTSLSIAGVGSFPASHLFGVQQVFIGHFLSAYLLVSLEYAE